MKQFVLILLSALVLSSCASRKDFVYLQDTPQVDTLYSLMKGQVENNIHFRPGDKITISVGARNKELSEMFNRSMYGQNANSAYTLDENGEIDFPFLGKIRIAGLDRISTEEYIKGKLIESELIKEPYVYVDYGNVGFYALGEISRKGLIQFTNDRTNILEAISQAGDLTQYGLRNNVLVIRRNGDGSENYYRIDLTSHESVYNSPAFYIQQNDIIYIEPNYKRRQESTVNGNTFSTYSVYISLVSTAMTLFLFFKNLN